MAKNNNKTDVVQYNSGSLMDKFGFGVDQTSALCLQAKVGFGDIDRYISFVNSIPLLSDQEEYQLATAWQQQQDVQSAKILVFSHLKLVVAIAKNYTGYGISLSDIIQEGTIGLMKAVKKFNIVKKVRLATFAIHWIKSEIHEFIIKNFRIVKSITTSIHRKLFFKLRSSRTEHGNLSNGEAEMLAKQLNVSKCDIIDMNMRLSGGDLPLLKGDEDNNENNTNWQSPILWLADDATPEKVLEKKLKDDLATNGVNFALKELDERSRMIIQARWLNEKATLQELAKQLNLSIEGVRKIEMKALKKMKECLNKYQKTKSTCGIKSI